MAYKISDSKKRDEAIWCTWREPIAIADGRQTSFVIPTPPELQGEAESKLEGFAVYTDDMPRMAQSEMRVLDGDQKPTGVEVDGKLVPLVVGIGWRRDGFALEMEKAPGQDEHLDMSRFVTDDVVAKYPPTGRMLYLLVRGLNDPLRAAIRELERLRKNPNRAAEIVCAKALISNGLAGWAGPVNPDDTPCEFTAKKAWDVLEQFRIGEKVARFLLLRCLDVDHELEARTLLD